MYLTAKGTPQTHTPLGLPALRITVSEFYLAFQPLHKVIPKALQPGISTAEGGFSLKSLVIFINNSSWEII